MDANVDMHIAVEDLASNPIFSGERLCGRFILNYYGIVEFVAPGMSIDIQNPTPDIIYSSSDDPDATKTDAPSTSCSDSVIYARTDSLRELASGISRSVTPGSDQPVFKDGRAEDSPVEDLTSDGLKSGCKWVDFPIDMSYYLMMSGKYEAARKYLKEVVRQDPDLDVLLLFAECFAIDGNCSVPCYSDFVDAVIKSDATIPDLLRWFQQVLRKTPDVNGLLRMCGLILLTYAIARKHEVVLCDDKPAYIKRLRDFVLSLDETGYMVILYGGTRRVQLSGFVRSILGEALDHLKKQNDDSDVNDAHRDYIIALTRFLVEKNVVDSLFQTKATIDKLERNVPHRSKFKVYGRLLGWKGILHLANGLVAKAIAAFNDSIAALEDATDENTGKDVTMRLERTRQNLEIAHNFGEFLFNFRPEALSDDLYD